MKVRVRRRNFLRLHSYMAKTELLEAVPVLSKSVLRRLALQKGSGVRKVDYEALRAACRAILVAIGENPEREGLVESLSCLILEIMKILN
jgi:hypothetical protein